MLAGLVPHRIQLPQFSFFPMLVMEGMVVVLPPLYPIARLLERFGQEAGSTACFYLHGEHHCIAHLQYEWSEQEAVGQMECVHPLKLLLEFYHCVGINATCIAAVI